MSAWPTGTRRARLAVSSGPLKRVHVNRHVIAANVKNGTDEPAVTIQTSAGSIPCYAAHIDGPSLMRSDKPLACGARVYLETRAPVIAIVTRITLPASATAHTCPTSTQRSKTK
jgi:hypothetical protein